MSAIAAEQYAHNRAYNNKFMLVVNLPPGLKDINAKLGVTAKTVSLDSLTFNTFKSKTPEIAVKAVESPYGGSTTYVSSHAREPFESIRVEFLIDNQFANYWTVYQWLNMLRDENEGTYGIVNARKLAGEDINLKDYSSIFNLYALDEFNNPIIRWDYMNAFPVRLGEIDWDYQVDSASEIKCYFDFVFSNIKCVRV